MMELMVGLGIIGAIVFLIFAVFDEKVRAFVMWMLLLGVLPFIGQLIGSVVISLVR